MDKTNCNRIRWIDAARGLAMCMIVFGHAIPGGMVKQFFYSFHVPVFFFLSGLLFRGGREKSFWDFLKKAWRIISAKCIQLWQKLQKKIQEKKTKEK